MLVCMKSAFERLIENGKIARLDSAKMEWYEVEPSEIDGWKVIALSFDGTVLIKDGLILEVSLN